MARTVPGAPPERIVGVTQARARLGKLLDDVRVRGATIFLSERGRVAAVLLSRAEYARLKIAATAPAREKLATALAATVKVPAEAGLDLWDVGEAVEEVRRSP